MIDPTKQHHRVSPEGVRAGKQMVRLIEPALTRLVAEGEADERCKTCAFREGTVPNGCIQTVADAMKAGLEDVPFLCHQGNPPATICFGWYAMRVRLRGLTMQCNWDFSPPD